MSNQAHKAALAGGVSRRGLPESSERGEEAFARATRHSRLVRTLKIMLPAAAILVSVAFAGYSFLSSAMNGTVDLASASIESGSLVMASPELNGFTSDNLPYKMTAERARQKIGSQDVIELEGIRAHVPVDKDNFATIQAEDGVYSRGDNKLDIKSPLLLKTTSGIIARLESAKIDIEKSTLESPHAVEIELDGTKIAADSFAASDGGKVFVFDKRVRVTIDPTQLKNAAKGQEQ